ncbi:FecR domain-containing protein [Flavicella sp.]|uniref:FecR family protein n=1 Tax=Flavicella sp. TaxID=2957742 RepID=UPI003018D9CD
MKNIPSHIFKLVLSYISKEINAEEFQELQKWVNKNKKNEQLFSDYLYVYKRSKRLKFIEKIDLNRAWNHMVSKLRRPLELKIAYQKKQVKVRRLKNTFNVFKYAAIAILFIGIGYLYQNGDFQKKSKIIKPTNNITLQLDDGRVKIIDESGDSKVLDANGNVVGEQKGVQLIYNKEVGVKILVYNTLTIPYGKRFEVKLSDGTKVHLNAGSSLKYPISFIKGKNRKVFLKGEAYFDVAKDAKHPFIVNADDMDVRVLGTRFNISSYPEDDNINTVLVEGSVSIYKKGELYTPETSTILKPGFMAAWQKNDRKIAIEKADIELATAWVDGKIIFRHTPFDDIIKKLERHYNVKIINNNKVLGKQRFRASFDIEVIEQVLESFNANFEIEYTIHNNQIIIN